MESLLPLKFFFSCSPQLATKIVGSIYLLIGFAGIILSIMAYSNDNSFDNEPITNDTDDTQDSELETGAVWLQLQSFQFVVSIVTFLFAICVLIAAWMNSRRRLFLLPWLIFQPLFTMIGFISTGYYAFWYWWDRDITMGIVYSAACFFIAVIGAICWKVIKNYYKELREPDKNNKDSSSEEKKLIIPQTDVRKPNNGGNVRVKIDNLEFK
ncbi:uncharacterized protein LOC124349175 [Daphnia pulicaria]|uniref:uncharacterized protein LOC124349175 n=1 Tax=Daphnia pulicaria TaxID=35523 RepID=UPI001EEAAA82|nr:uncharacterized protein LOC124349175 [Daphnia pulicaria]